MPNLKIIDYPKFGVWPDAYYMTDNQFDDTQFRGVGVFAFDRTRMLTGNPGAGHIYFDLEAAVPEAGGMLPSDLDGPTPPPATPNHFAFFTADEFGDPQGDGIRLFAFVPDFASPASSTFSELPFVAVAPFDPRSRPGPDIDQPPPGSPGFVADRVRGFGQEPGVTE